MSSSRPTRSSQRTPASVGSKGKKKARTTEEPTPTPEDYIYRSGLCKNRFVQDFRNRKVIAGDGLIFKWFSENGFDFKRCLSFKLCEWENVGLSSSSLNSMVNALMLGRSSLKTMGGTGKFEYITFLDLFVMYCLITHTPMNLGHLMINHMKAATEKKRQGLPYGMFFTHMFHILEVDLGGEVRETPKASKEYNQKTLRLMGFTQNDEGFWIKKADATPQKRSHRGSDSDANSEDEEEIPLLELLPLPPELRESILPSSISFFAYGVIIPNTPFPLS
ncbi:hypothetical protein CJ030_MR3G015810 [Morella rubra]|uniref:Uncharacterized protein n=1 Tax=Morella rubra TaxID=262757 RepID=A0A6A1W919_9ROSI|nr:hypothetical protein CJ030_MR3G015810 [Morella rubra]